MKITVNRVIKHRLAALLLDLIEGEIDEKESAIALLRLILDELENS